MKSINPNPELAFNTSGKKPNIVRNFNSTYYSGLDLQVWFEDYHVDEIINIQYQVSENVLPLYNYASYTYTALAKGTRIIQGSFSINFRDSYTIKELIRRATEQKSVSKVHDAVTTVDIPVTLPSSFSTSDVSKILSGTNRVGNDKLIKNLSEWYKTKFWERVSDSKEAPQKFQNTTFFSNAPKGFTMYLKYNNKVFDESTISASNYKDLVGYATDSGNRVIEALTDVHITSIGKAIDDSGKNILEVCNFISQDLILKSD